MHCSYHPHPGSNPAVQSCMIALRIHACTRLHSGRHPLSSREHHSAFMKPVIFLLTVLLLMTLAAGVSQAQAPDLIVHHGKIVTVDQKFTTVEAMAVKDGLIL